MTGMDQFIDGLAHVIAAVIAWVGVSLVGAAAVIVGYAIQCLILVALILPVILLVDRFKAKRRKTP